MVKHHINNMPYTVSSSMLETLVSFILMNLAPVYDNFLHSLASIVVAIDERVLRTRRSQKELYCEKLTGISL
jgi:hypothetical protein